MLDSVPSTSHDILLLFTDNQAHQIYGVRNKLALRVHIVSILVAYVLWGSVSADSLSGEKLSRCTIPIQTPNRLTITCTGTTFFVKVHCLFRIDTEQIG